MKVRWIGGGSSTWFPVAEPLPLFYAGGGASSGGTIPTYVEVSGLVNDPAVHEVAVTLNDGTREVTPVENGAFLYVKAGTLLPITAEALDAQGNVLHQQDLP